MQNNNKPKGFRTFLKEKGYYIVLLLCAVAVGVSGYFLLKPSATQTEPSPSAESPTESTPKATTGKPGKEPAANVVATDGTEEETTQPPTRMTVVRPVEGELLTAFAADHLAYNETTRDWRTHEGIDLSAELGQNVAAAADGTVYTIYEDESLGMTVVLRHADGYTTHYSNLGMEPTVQVGDAVTAGSVIGTVGQTAGIETATAPHLHFAVYQNNRAVDPDEFFAS